MRINLLSSFAAGILITTTICGAVYFAGTSDVTKVSLKTAENSKTVNISENEMINKLVTKGYIVQTKAEFEKKVQDAKVSVQNQAAPKDDKAAKTITRVVVNVSQGMTSIDVGKMLVKAKLIPNAYNFSHDVEKKHLENKLRPGTYVVDSEMTKDQVIATIFK
ncbi:aminodeoxychorismate lyase [Neobacillus soli]|uniref:aminodeoxychorismate lyase n=1 Tax=Neobacillus soli TaxID=220688 RepID=UPI000AE121F5|nr:aminodeoxychorismate lyase [Neobacillus soli]